MIGVSSAVYRAQECGVDTGDDTGFVCPYCREAIHIGEDVVDLPEILAVGRYIPRRVYHDECFDMLGVIDVAALYGGERGIA